MKGNIKFSILHTNDTHSYLDDFARRDYLITKLKEENSRLGIDTLLFDSGDTFGGNIYFTMYEGLKEADLMSRVGYDAMALGNHEFDRGSLVLSNFISNINFPVIASNLDVKKDKHLSKHLSKLRTYIIKDVSNGLRVGIFGLVTPDTVQNASPSAETKFKDLESTATEMVKELKAKGANVIIVLSHIGLLNDKIIASQVEGIDLIIGGHSHDLTGPVPYKWHNTLIVQAGAYGEYLGRLDLYINKEGTLSITQAKAYNIKDYPESEKLKGIVAKLKYEKAKVATECVGKTLTLLDGTRSVLDLGETNMGNLVADAFYHKAKELGYFPDLAIVNGRGIRSSIEEGDITFGDVINVLPFSCTLKVIKATGRELIYSLEQGISPQVSGLRITYKDGKAKVWVATATGYKRINRNKVYTIATNSFVGLGKDNYLGFKSAEVVANNLELDAKVLGDYIKTLPLPFNYEKDGRIVHIKT